MQAASHKSTFHICYHFKRLRTKQILLILETTRINLLYSFEMECGNIGERH